MRIYAESSAILTWLLGDSGEGDVRECLASAELVIASELTLLECDRVLIRAATLGELSEADGAGRRATLTAAAVHWTMLQISAAVIERAWRPFPGEPIRTLDALHLASALVARSAVEDLALLSFDSRLRACARSLGFELRPNEVAGRA